MNIIEIDWAKVGKPTFEYNLKPEGPTPYLRDLFEVFSKIAEYQGHISIFYHMSDMDGVVSGGLLGLTVQNSQDVSYHPYTYSKRIDAKTLSPGLVIFVDVIPWVSDMAEILKSNEVIVIDHHITSLDRYKKCNEQIFDSITWVYGNIPCVYQCYEGFMSTESLHNIPSIHTIISALTLYDVSCAHLPKTLFAEDVLGVGDVAYCNYDAILIDYGMRYLTEYTAEGAKKFLTIFLYDYSWTNLKLIIEIGKTVKATYQHISKLIRFKYMVDTDTIQWGEQFMQLSQYKVALINVPNYDSGSFFEGEDCDISIMYTVETPNLVRLNLNSKDHINLLEMFPFMSGHPHEAACTIDSLEKLFILKE